MPKLYQEGLRPRCEDPRRTWLHREGSHPCRHVPADHARRDSSIDVKSQGLSGAGRLDFKSFGDSGCWRWIEEF